MDGLADTLMSLPLIQVNIYPKKYNTLKKRRQIQFGSSIEAGIELVHNINGIQWFK